MSLFKKRKGKPLKTSENDEKEIQTLFPFLEENINYICEAFGNTDDLKTRNVTFNGRNGKLIYLETMADAKEIQKSFLIPLAEAEEGKDIKDLITSVESNISTRLNEAVSALLSGSCALFLRAPPMFFCSIRFR